jgi:hypothetical protein
MPDLQHKDLAMSQCIGVSSLWAGRPGSTLIVSVHVGQSSGGMVQQNLSTYCAGEPSRFAIID